MRSALLFLLLSAPAFLRAEALSLDEAQARAQANGNDLRQTSIRRDQARQQRLGALSGFLPSLSLGASQGQSGSYDPNASLLGEFSGGRPSVGLNLSASQNLFRGGADWAAVKQAGIQLELAEESLRKIKADTVYTARSAWAQLLFAQQQAQQNADTAKRREDNVALVQLRFDAGRENKGSLLQTQAQALQAKVDARRAQRELKSSRRALAKAMGQDLSDLSAAGDLPVPLPATEADDAQLALQHPEARTAQLNLNLAQSTMDADAANWLPSLGASASVNRSGQEWMPNNGSWSMGLNLSWNLFGGFDDLVSRREKASSLVTGTLALEEARRFALEAISSARETLENSLDQLEVREALLKAAEARAEIAKAQYAQGLIGFEDWDRIESDLISARSSSLSGRLSAANAGFSWDRALTKGWEP